LTITETYAADKKSTFVINYFIETQITFTHFTLCKENATDGKE